MKVLSKLFAGLVLLSMASVSLADPLEIRIQRSKNSSFQHLGLIHLDQIEKVAAKHGVDVKVVPMDIPNSGVANDLLVKGDLDITVTSLSAYGNLQAVMGDNVKLLTGFASYRPQLVCQQPWRSIAEMPKEKKIAMKNLRSTQQLMIRQISKAETGDYFTYDDRIAVIPHDQNIQLMEAADPVIECHCCVAPTQNILQRKGFHKVYEGGVEGRFPSPIVTYARADWLDANPAAGAIVIEALQEAIKIYNADKLAAVKHWIEHDNLVKLDATQIVKDNEENVQEVFADLDNADVYINTVREMGAMKGDKITYEQIVWRPNVDRKLPVNALAIVEKNKNQETKNTGFSFANFVSNIWK